MRTLNFVVFLICLVCFTFCNASTIAGHIVSRDLAVTDKQESSSASSASEIIHGLASQVQPYIDAIRTSEDAHNGSTTFFLQQIGVISQSIQRATAQIVQLNGKSAPIIPDGVDLLAELITFTTTLLLETLGALASLLDLAGDPDLSSLIAAVSRDFEDLMSAVNDLSAPQQKRARHIDQLQKLTGFGEKPIVY